jgi:hypothetical protein
MQLHNNDRHIHYVVINISIIKNQLVKSTLFYSWSLPKQFCQQTNYGVRQSNFGAQRCNSGAQLVADKLQARIGKMFLFSNVLVFLCCPFLPNEKSILKNRGTKPTNPSTQRLIRLKRIYNFLCSMLVFTPFAYCFVTLSGTFMYFWN